jgi:hypothetical protein
MITTLININLSSLIIIFGFAISQAQSIENLVSKLPENISSWSVLDEKFYDHQDLHEYLSGGVERYLSYGLHKIYSCEFTSDVEPSIVLEIFDMNQSENAYGIFSHSREKMESDFGQGSQYSKGLLLFWKNRYFISILVSPESAAGKEAVFDLAKILDKEINGEGPLPALISILPEDNLRNESICYFHHHIWLNTHFFISDDNIFHIDSETEAILAKYGKVDREGLLLLVLYPDSGKAKRAKQNFLQKYLDGLDDKTMMCLKDGRWTAWQVNNRLLSVVFNAPSEIWCIRILSEIKRKYQSALLRDN